MDAADPGRRTDAAVWLERAHALLMLLPAAALLWPGSGAPLAGDPNPELTGAAVAAIAAIPALALTLVRGAQQRAPWAFAFVAFVCIGFVSLLVAPPTDTLEASRAMLLATTGLALLLSGASLEDVGRATLVRGLVVVALFALAPALYGVTPRYSGMLGNTGSTSEIAALGALAGVALFAKSNGIWRWTGLAAVALDALYCGLAPVFAGAVVLALALAITLVTSAKQRAFVGVLALIAAFAFVGARLALTDTPGKPATAQASDTGGANVRRLIWQRTAAMIGDHALLGTGPGQFAAVFPPYRDEREIELSTHGRRIAQETEVEHAHNDWLQAFADAGSLGGLAWLVFAGAIVWRSLRALRGEDDDRAALGLVALGVLCNSALREPLFWNPASSSAAFAVFGALLRPSVVEPRALTRRVAPVVVALAVLCVQVPRAQRIRRYGAAMAAYLVDKQPEQLAIARNACPDSSVVRSFDAREIDGRDDPKLRAQVIEAWRAVLATRPHRFEALVDLGIALAAEERVDETRAIWRQALELDPKNPTLLRNLARFEALVGDIDQALHWLRVAESERDGSASVADVELAGSLRALGAAALREVRIERGWQIFSRSGARFEKLDADLAYQLAHDASLALDDEQASALEGSAHVMWARAHAATGDAAAAVRSYRQAKRCLNLELDKHAPARWHASLHLELAAALCLDGKLDDARRELDSVVHSVSDLVRLPAWAGQALMSANLLGGGAQ
jgi:O-antigen ligase/tetratricopeptide (TPR) repeat protein